MGDAAAVNQAIPTSGDKWDTAKVTDMRLMFASATAFNQELKTWDTGEVTTMQNMFNGAAKFNKDLTSWKTKLGKVTNNVDMWTGATAMTPAKKPCTTPATSATGLTWPACPVDSDGD